MSQHRYGLERETVKAMGRLIRAEMEPGRTGVKLRVTLPELGQSVDAGEFAPQVLVDMGARIDPDDRSTWRGSMRLTEKFINQVAANEPVKAFES